MTPALKTRTAPRPTDTTAPGLLRRRVWAAPEVRSHALVVLTAARLYLAPPAVTPPRPDAVAAVENGADPDVAVGPLGTTIDLANVRAVRLDLVGAAVRVEYAGAGRGAAAVVVRFAGPEPADALFSRLWRRVGDGFTLTPFRADPWAAARGPVGAMLGVLLVTLAALAGLPALADAGFDLPPGADWRVAGGLGGAALAVAQVVLYRRLTRPPVRLELTRN